MNVETPANENDAIDENKDEKEESGPTHRSRKLTVREKEMVLRILKYFQLEKKQQHLFVPLTHAYQRAAAACNVSFSTVKKISKEYRVHGEIQPAKKPQRKSTQTVDEAAIKNAVLAMYENKEHVTLKTIKERLKTLNIFNGGETSISFIMKRIGFKFKKDHQFLNKGVFCESKKSNKKPRAPRKKRATTEPTNDKQEAIELTNESKPSQIEPNYVVQNNQQMNQPEVTRIFWEADYQRCANRPDPDVFRHFGNRMKKPGTETIVPITSVNMTMNNQMVHEQMPGQMFRNHSIVSMYDPKRTDLYQTQQPQMFTNTVHPHFLGQYTNVNVVNRDLKYQNGKNDP